MEIGSNDGTLLRHAAHAGIRHLGIEPSASVAETAIAGGVATMRRFFDAEVAREIVAEHGQAHAIVAANALSHIADLHSVVEGIAILLAPAGRCVIEDPYWGDVVAATAFDQIYDEHASYFTLSSLSYLFAQHGLTVLDAIPTDVHGGSMRYLIGRPGSQPAAARVERLLEHERAMGLHRPETFAGFRDRVTNTGMALMTLLRSCEAEGKRTVGYGATSKSTTTINFFGITPRSRRVHQRHDAGQAGHVQPGGTHSGPAARRICRTLPGSGAAVPVEPRRRSAGQGSGVRARRRKVDRLRAGGSGVVTAVRSGTIAPA